MLVGKSESRTLPAFFTEGVNAPITYFESVNFVSAAQDKRPDALKTVLFNLAMSPKFIPSISLIRNHIKDSGADVVVNFYEILGTIAHGLTGRKVPMVCIGHQFLFLHKDMHVPEFGYEGHIALNLFSRAIATGAEKVLALSFRQMPHDGKIRVVPPLLRPEVLAYRNSPDFKDGDYILGYMLNAGFAEEVNSWHEAHPSVPLRFSGTMLPRPRSRSWMTRSVSIIWMTRSSCARWQVAVHTRLPPVSSPSARQCIWASR